MLTAPGASSALDVSSVSAQGISGVTNCHLLNCTATSMLNISNRGIAINAFLADTLAERVLHESLSRIPTGLRVQTCRAVVPGLLSTLLPAHPLQDRHIQARPIISRTWVSLSRLVRQVPDATDFPVKNGLACLTTAPDFSRLRCEATKANALYLDYRNSLLDNDPHQGALLNILT